jgi:hypothetical protein
MKSVTFQKQTLTVLTATPPEKRLQEGRWFRENDVEAMVSVEAGLAYYSVLSTTILGIALAMRGIEAYHIIRTSTSGVLVGKLVGSLLPTDEETAQSCIQYLYSQFDFTARAEVPRELSATKGQSVPQVIEDYAAHYGQWYRLAPLSEEEKAILKQRKSASSSRVGLSEQAASPRPQVSELETERDMNDE